jgi:hypothetical protein
MKVKSPLSWVGAGCVGLGILLGMAPAPALAAETGPVRIAFVGDSMADGLWGALFRRLGKDKCLGDKITLIRKAKNGTGLARLDQFNWVAEVGTMAKEGAADVFVGSFGINDRQAIVDASRVRTEFDTPNFDSRYQSFTEDLIKNAISNGGSILIAGLPVMQDSAANSDAKAKNKLFEAAVAAVNSPLATYVKPWSSKAGEDEYQPFLPNSNNQLVQFRAQDGIHFTRFGYDQVMDYFYPSIMAALKARGRDVLSECSK